jgi:glutathione S-transferase
LSELTLVVGTESTWSIRALLCVSISGLCCDEIIVDLGNGAYKEQLKEYSETMLVPVLVHNSVNVHDSLAIAEYINELTNGALYPKDKSERAIARSLCAELHSGFMHLRSACPFTFEQRAAVIVTPDIASELNRLKSIWCSAQGSFMYKSAGVVDAFYSVLAYRLSSYGFEFDGKAGLYQQSLLNWRLFQETINRASDWRDNGA